MKFPVLSFLLMFVGIFEYSEAQCSMTNATVACLDQLGQGAAFTESRQITTSSIELFVAIDTVTYNWLSLKRRMYNGTIAGPTLVVNQGETFSVKLKNTLSADGNDLGKPLNYQSNPNSTNIHTHGLHISSMDPQDNVLINVKPETEHAYVYQIHPKNSPGTYWYHAHLHGSVMFQVNSGLSGMLIVADSTAAMPTELAAVSCPDNCDKDIQMLFQPILKYKGGRGFGALQNAIDDSDVFRNDQYTLVQGGTLAKFLYDNLNRVTTNGQLEPDLAMTTGQMYRFRMVNAGGSDTLEVYIVTKDGAAATACTIREIAIDGVYLDAPRAMHNSQSFLVPAARVDWLVKCDTAGIYYLKSFGDPVHDLSIGGISRFEGNLVKLTVSGAAVAPVQTFPTTLPSRPTFLKDLRNVSEADIGGRFVIELNPKTYLNREKWSSGDYFRYKMKVDTIQEWHLLNTDTSTSHPIHIHVNHFQIISYNNYTGGFGNRTGDVWELIDIDDQKTPCLFQHANATADRSTASEKKFATIPETDIVVTGKLAAADTLKYLGHDKRFIADAGDTLGYSRLGDWRDVVLVPPLANITIRFMAHELVGTVVIHCHILDHEDTGMMMVVDVVREGESLDANTPSGDAYPGSCRACDRYPFNNSTTLAPCGVARTSGMQGIFETCNIGVLVLFTALSVFSTLL